MWSGFLLVAVRAPAVAVGSLPKSAARLQHGGSAMPWAVSGSGALTARSGVREAPGVATCTGLLRGGEVPRPHPRRRRRCRRTPRRRRSPRAVCDCFSSCASMNACCERSTAAPRRRASRRAAWLQLERRESVFAMPPQTPCGLRRRLLGRCPGAAGTPPWASRGCCSPPAPRRGSRTWWARRRWRCAAPASPPSSAWRPPCGGRRAPSASGRSAACARPRGSSRTRSSGARGSTPCRPCRACPSRSGS